MSLTYALLNSSNILGNNSTYSTGSHNTANGAESLYVDTTGSNNTASGYQSLHQNSTGNNNIAIGYDAGYNLTTGNSNIEIGNTGTPSDHNVIKIGTQGVQTATFLAGIFGNTKVKGLSVIINSSGQLGVLASSERFKTEIAPMGSSSNKVLKLRPVTFKLKSDQSGTRQYGLIAEEVAKLYPELVVTDEKGIIDGVRYDELAPMLLNELQKQRKTSEAQAEQMAAQSAQIAALNQRLTVMQAELGKLLTKDEMVARR